MNLDQVELGSPYRVCVVNAPKGAPQMKGQLEDIGFLPGSQKEKLDPWMVPIWDNMRKVYNHQEQLQSLQTSKLKP